MHGRPTAAPSYSSERPTCDRTRAAPPTQTAGLRTDPGVPSSPPPSGDLGALLASPGESRSLTQQGPQAGDLDVLKAYIENEVAVVGADEADLHAASCNWGQAAGAPRLSTPAPGPSHGQRKAVWRVPASSSSRSPRQPAAPPGCQGQNRASGAPLTPPHSAQGQTPGWVLTGASVLAWQPSWVDSDVHASTHPCSSGKKRHPLVILSQGTWGSPVLGVLVPPPGLLAP